jgi:hypothetical protein
VAPDAVVKPKKLFSVAISLKLLLNNIRLKRPSTRIEDAETDLSAALGSDPLDAPPIFPDCGTEQSVPRSY